MNKKDTKRIAQALAGSASKVVIEQPKIQGVVLEVEGTMPIIQNCFGQKALEQMLRKHMGLSVQRETKKPRECLEYAKIRNVEDRICVPPQAFKSAMLTASTEVKGLKKTQLRTQLYVAGGSIPIKFKTETARMDMVRTAGIGRTPDVRFRPQFEGWTARLYLQFGDLLSVQTVVDLLNRAGRVGVGEWRPERNGVFGTFRVSRHVMEVAEIEEVILECSVPLVTPTIPEWALDATIDPQVVARIMREESEEGETVEGRELSDDEVEELEQAAVREERDKAKGNGKGKPGRDARPS